LLVGIGVALLPALLLAGLALREPLAERLWPESRIQQLLANGEQALAQGRLSAADGGGARQKFEAAQALDSDRGEARAGLARVALAALAQVNAALGEGRDDDARQALALARELQVPRDQAAAVEARLREHEAGKANIGVWLEQAEAALQDGRIDGADDAALPLYRKVLTFRPELVQALEGREDALSILLQRARQALRRDDLAAAADGLAQVRHYDAGHMELPDTQASFARAVERQLRLADADLERGRLQRAAERYRMVAKAVPEQQAAAQGLQEVAREYARTAGKHAADFRFADAERSLQAARELTPASPELARVQNEIERARQSQARLNTRLSAADRRRLQTLLADAANAGTQGNWLLPPGASVYDKLRAAQALAPDDAQVRQTGIRLRQAMRRCVEQELRRNRVRSAGSCYEAWFAIAPNDPELAATRRDLALRWLAIGDERLGAGELTVAAQALDQARAFDPQAPGLEDFALRMRQALSGSGD
jgi:hypothetical protein